MRKLVLLILFLFSTSYSQNLKLGGSFNFVIVSTNLSNQVGPGIKLQYEFENVPIAVQGNANFFLGKISYLNVSTYANAAIGTSVLYYPIKFSIQPYVGASIFYNFNGMSQTGNQNFILLDQVNNNFSMEFLLGLNLTPENSTNLLVECEYSYHKPAYKAYYRNQKDTITAGQFNLNSLYLKIGLLFSLN